MSNNDNSLIERLTTIIDRPPISMNISGNQLNKLRKDKSQYDSYVFDLKQYQHELENSIKYIDPAIERTFSKLKDDLVKIVYSIVKNLTGAESIVNVTIKSPADIVGIEINTILTKLVHEINIYIGLEEKYAFVQQQIRAIEHSKQYLNELNRLRKEREYELEFPPTTYYVRPVITQVYSNSNNTNEIQLENENNNVFLAKEKSQIPLRKKNQYIGSLIEQLPSLPTNNEIVYEFEGTPKVGGNNYKTSNESNAINLNDDKKTTPIINPDERKNLPPSYIKEVIRQLKVYLLTNSRNKNTNRDKLAKLDLIDSPAQLLAHLKVYNNILFNQYKKLQSQFKQNMPKIQNKLFNANTQLTRLIYIKQHIGPTITNIKEYIETLGTPFTTKSIFINKKNKPKFQSGVKLLSNYNKTLKKRGYSNTATRKNQNRNTRPWWRRLFTRKQQPQAQSQVIERQTPVSAQFPPTLRYNFTQFPEQSRIPEKKEVKWENENVGIEKRPLTKILEYKENQPVALLREPVNAVESVITEPVGISVNWAAQPAPTSWWGRLFRRTPITVRTTIGSPVQQNTRKWYQKLNPFSKRSSSGGKYKTRKLRK